MLRKLVSSISFCDFVLQNFPYKQYFILSIFSSDSYKRGKHFMLSLCKIKKIFIYQNI